ncbi:5e35a59c-5119-4bdb-a9fd-c1b8173769f9 [Thermothielavioides terrestris]|uniref:5e35a59c-5119-4bdb-a9fd-c1b8173769f9 n=1 Tax=Thermothielavioides terrestris TaxID=2587410 RepID=A0A446BG88_9PEZI|nr:5e35a59c-5119-4bdb-a9fd-c1b8173769f9 [Thermothielavioides terrestris]
MSTDTANLEGTGDIFSGTSPAVQWFEQYSWLLTVIVAAVGWLQTWPLARFMLKVDQHYQYVADRRYTGLAKRTIWPAFLAHRSAIKCTPRLVVGCAAMDQGVSSQLEDLEDAQPATKLTYLIWAVQLVSTVWLFLQVCLVWTRGVVVPVVTSPIYPPVIHDWAARQLTQVLAATTVNRGTWAIAVAGSFLAWGAPAWLYLTTVIATMVELACLCRAAVIARDSYAFNQSLSFLQRDAAKVREPIYMFAVGFPFVAVVLEAGVLVYGYIAALFKIKFLHPL